MCQASYIDAKRVSEIARPEKFAAGFLLPAPESLNLSTKLVLTEKRDKRASLSRSVSMRRYITLRTRAADIDQNTDGENYLARTIHEDTDPRDTGLLDWTGAKLFAVNEMEQIGFVRSPLKTEA